MGIAPILCYHHISDIYLPIIKEHKYMGVTAAHFQQQLSMLCQIGFRCLDLPQVITKWHEKRPHKQSFVLSFDDGYKDFYEIALPILNQFGLSATIFIIVQMVEEGNEHCMSWRQIGELARNNFTLGSHTMTHPRLNSLNSQNIKRELYESKMIMEDRLGLPVNLLAYPYGDSNKRVREIAREVGYHAAVGVTHGNIDQYNIWRVPINSNESKLSFLWKAFSGFYYRNYLLECSYIGRKIRQFRENRRIDKLLYSTPNE